MILLEKAEELHRHIDECHYCTCGAREGILCFPGRLLLAAAMGEAALLSSRASQFDRLVAQEKIVAVEVSEALRAEREPVPAARPARRERKQHPIAPGLQRAKGLLNGQTGETLEAQA